MQHGRDNFSMQVYKESMWALSSYDAVADTPDDDRGGPDPSAYDLIVARRRDEAALKQQLRKHGDAEMRGGAAEAPGGMVRAYRLKAPGARAKKQPHNHPLRDLLDQMGLKHGKDIDACCGKKSSGRDGGTVKIGNWERSGVAPLANPQKAWALSPSPNAHALCLPAGHCTAAVGSISSGKTVAIQSAIAQNAAQWAYESAWLMHPDSDAALGGEYGLCSGMKALDEFKAMDWWNTNSPGRTCLCIDDVALNALTSRGGQAGQRALADRTLGYLRSHKEKSMDIYIGTQHIYNLPPGLRKYVGCWMLFPKRISPSTYGALATATMIDKSVLKQVLDLVTTQYGFVMINNMVAKGRPRVQIFDPDPRWVEGEGL